MLCFCFFLFVREYYENSMALELLDVENRSRG